MQCSFFTFLACIICLCSFENLTRNSLRLADEIVKPVDHRQPHTKPTGNCDQFDEMDARTITVRSPCSHTEPCYGLCHYKSTSCSSSGKSAVESQQCASRSDTTTHVTPTAIVDDLGHDE